MPKGQWLATRSGIHVYPLDFKPEMVDIRDITCGLSNLCRFRGSVPKFYSVAEHSVIMAQVILDKWGDPEIALQALLHDSAEAYVGDLPNPLKRMPEFEFFKHIENSILQVIFGVFALPPTLHQTVTNLDRAMLLAEARKFFPLDVETWEYPDKATTPRLNVEFKCWAPTTARMKFTEMLHMIQEIRGMAE